MANGDSPKTRYHAEVKVTIDGHEARINCFRDVLDEVFLDIATIIDQFPGNWKSPAKRELANAQLKADQLRKEGHVKPDTLEGVLVGDGEIPVCDECGTDEYMELIQFTDKKTGAPRRAWKCQQCKEWHWPDKNGKGR
mgnify:CR=1 FL=1